MRQDNDTLPADLVDELLAAGKREDSEICLWLDEATGRCKYYEHRPILCREFELGGDVCLSVRKLYHID